MRLSSLLESTHEESFIVYSVSSPQFDKKYYGYARGSDIADVKHTFVSGGTRTEDSRADVRFVELAGGVDRLQFRMIDIFLNEVEALVARNDLRATESDSFSGPTKFPIAAFKRAAEQFPGKTAEWSKAARRFKMTNLNNVSARDAMSEPYADVSGLSFDVVKQRASGDPSARKAIVADLDKMSYTDFMMKWFPTK